MKRLPLAILAVVAALSIGFIGVGFLAAACYLVAAVPVLSGRRVALRELRPPQVT